MNRCKTCNNIIYDVWFTWNKDYCRVECKTAKPEERKSLGESKFWGDKVKTK
jgi:hypothetical protein